MLRYYVVADCLGGGIVFDSDPYDEYVETLNKLGANMQCITQAEKMYARMQSNDAAGAADGEALGTGTTASSTSAHIDLAAG